jgi:hypothetical protein
MLMFVQQALLRILILVVNGEVMAFCLCEQAIVFLVIFHVLEMVISCCVCVVMVNVYVTLVTVNGRIVFFFYLYRLCHHRNVFFCPLVGNNLFYRNVHHVLMFFRVHLVVAFRYFFQPNQPTLVRLVIVVTIVQRCIVGL